MTAWGAIYSCVCCRRRTWSEEFAVLYQEYTTCSIVQCDLRIGVYRSKHEENILAKSRYSTVQIFKNINSFSEKSSINVILYGIESEKISKSKRTFINLCINIFILQNRTILSRFLDQCAKISNYAHLCARFHTTRCGPEGPMQKKPHNFVFIVLTNVTLFNI